MPMMVEAVFTMLPARLEERYTPSSSGFMTSLAKRIDGANPKVMVTTDAAGCAAAKPSA